MQRFALLALVASTMTPSAVFADFADPTSPVDGERSGMPDFRINDDINPLIPHLGAVKPDAITELPVDGFVGLEAEGEIFFVSNNGRYVIQGRAHDLWYDLPLNSMENIDISATTLRLADMGIDTRRLSTLTLGDPEAGLDRVHTVFIDPYCDHCLSYAEDVDDLALDGSGEAVAFVLVPAFGDSSLDAVEHFVCRDDTVDDRQALEALLSKTLESLPQRDAENCDLTPYRSSLLVAEQLQVNGVPFTATASGDVIRGLPDNIAGALRVERD